MDPLETVARELGLLIRSLKGMHSAVTASVGSRVELPASALLNRLAEQGRQRPSALAEALHVDLSSVSRQVAALEREGWVARERDPDDSRAALLELTDEGRRVLDEVRAARVAHLRSRLPGWTAEELEAFAAQLHRFRTDIADAPEDVPVPSAPPTPPSARPAPARTPAYAGQEDR